MAVEDGAVLGKLLGLASRSPGTNSTASVHEVLELYEPLRKSRTTANIKGAQASRRMFHLHDGDEQRPSDTVLRIADWKSPSSWKYVDPEYNLDALGFEAVQDLERIFKLFGE